MPIGDHSDRHFGLNELPKVVVRQSNRFLSGGGKMRLPILLSILFVAAGTATAQQYTATPITSANSAIFFANLIDLNNKGEVLGDACIANCGVNRFPAVWANGVFQALPIPPGYQYSATLQEYKINDSGDVVGGVLLPST